MSGEVGPDVIGDLAVITGGLLGASDKETWTVVFQGPQTAGTLKTLGPIAQDCYLRLAAGKCSGVILSTNATSSAGLPSGGFKREGIICKVDASISNISWIGKHRIPENSYIYLDSSGGMGAAEWIHLVFEKADFTQTI